jgi:hypothetical protein
MLKKIMFFILLVPSTSIFSQLNIFNSIEKTYLQNRFFCMDEDIFLRKDSTSIIYKELMKGSYSSSIDKFLIKKYFTKHSGKSGEIKVLDFGDTEAYSVFKYNDSNFTINADPVLGFAVYNSSNNKNIPHTFNGLGFLGTFGKHLLFDGLFFDNHEELNPLKNRVFTRETGIHVAVANGDYGESRGNLRLVYDWGTFSIGKDFLNVGSGYDGNLIFSSKAPAFPYFGYNIFPTDWLSFTYIHGWLKSGIMDSSSLRRSSVSDTVKLAKYIYSDISKYIAMHYLTIKTGNLKVLLGESMVYSKSLKYEYCIPVLFFRFIDHYNSNANSGNNAQMFADFSYIVPHINSKFYFSFFIDELQLSDLLKGAKGNNQTGYTIGCNAVDPFWKNSNIIIEYTKILPFVYMNSNPAETYTSSGYQLGHWIGSNADELYISLRQFLSSNIYCSLWTEFIRKGSQETTDQEYSETRPPFLFGTKSYFYNIGAEVLWEPINKMKFYLRYIRNLKSSNKFLDQYMLSEKNNFNFSIAYGL